MLKRRALNESDHRDKAVTATACFAACLDIIEAGERAQASKQDDDEKKKDVNNSDKSSGSGSDSGLVVARGGGSSDAANIRSRCLLQYAFALHLVGHNRKALECLQRVDCQELRLETLEMRVNILIAETSSPATTTTSSDASDGTATRSMT